MSIVPKTSNQTLKGVPTTTSPSCSSVLLDGINDCRLPEFSMTSVASSISSQVESSIKISQIPAGAIETPTTFVLFIGDQIHNKPRKIFWLLEVADSLLKARATREARAVLRQALMTVHHMEKTGDKAWFLSQVAGAIARAGDLSAACTFLEKARTFANQVENKPYFKVSLLGRVVDGLQLARDSHGALKILKEALRLVSLLKEHADRASALRELAEVLVRPRKRKQARSILEQACASARQMETGFEKVWQLTKIADALRSAGDFAGASLILEETRAIAIQIGNKESAADALATIAKAFIRTEQGPHAVEVLQQALSVTTQINEESDRTSSLRFIAEVAVDVPDPEPMLQGLLEYASGIEKPSNKIWILLTLAEALVGIGRIKQSRKLIQQATEFIGTLDDISDQAGALRGVAETLTKVGKTEQAHLAIHQAITLAARIPDTQKRATAMSHIALTLTRFGEVRAALVVACSMPRYVFNEVRGGYGWAVDLGEQAETIRTLQNLAAEIAMPKVDDNAPRAPMKKLFKPDEKKVAAVIAGLMFAASESKAG